MSELIVLGLIPGTQIQITFALWMVLVTGLGLTTLIWVGHRLHIFRDWVITVSLFVLTKRQLQA